MSQQRQRVPNLPICPSDGVHHPVGEPLFRQGLCMCFCHDRWRTDLMTKLQPSCPQYHRAHNGQSKNHSWGNMAHQGASFLSESLGQFYEHPVYSQQYSYAQQWLLCIFSMQMETTLCLAGPAEWGTVGTGQCNVHHSKYNFHLRAYRAHVLLCSVTFLVLLGYIPWLVFLSERPQPSAKVSQLSITEITAGNQGIKTT